MCIFVIKHHQVFVLCRTLSFSPTCTNGCSMNPWDGGAFSLSTLEVQQTQHAMALLFHISWYAVVLFSYISSFCVSNNIFRKYLDFSGAILCHRTQSNTHTKYTETQHTYTHTHKMQTNYKQQPLIHTTSTTSESELEIPDNNYYNSNNNRTIINRRVLLDVGGMFFRCVCVFVFGVCVCVCLCMSVCICVLVFVSV